MLKKQTEKICLEAVKNNGLALDYVREQTPTICLEAVKNNRLAIKYISALMYELIKNELYNLYKISHSDFSKLPGNILEDDFSKLLQLDKSQFNNIYGFILDNNKWCLVGSLFMFDNFIKNNFKDSTITYVYIPFTHSLMDVTHIKWIKI